MVPFSSTHGETTHELVVVSRIDVADRVIELEFQATNESTLPVWSAGAHIDLKLANGLSRQYSLMRGLLASNNWRIAVLVEEQGRGGSVFIRDHYVVGSRLTAVGPRNHFSLVRAKEYVFIAGGIGVTPLVEMIAEAQDKNIKWQLAYLGSRRESMAYQEVLVDMYPQQVSTFISSENTRLNLDDFAITVPSEAEVYCCGPEALMLEVERIFSDRAHVERFHPREQHDLTPNRPFIVYCSQSDLELEVDADESILMTADFAGIEIPGDCMEGTCGSCETRVLEGEVDHRDSVLSQEARNTGDTMMICVSRARGKRLVIEL